MAVFHTIIQEDMRVLYQYNVHVLHVHYSTVQDKAFYILFVGSPSPTA